MGTPALMVNDGGFGTTITDDVSAAAACATTVLPGMLPLSKRPTWTREGLERSRTGTHREFGSTPRRVLRT